MIYLLQLITERHCRLAKTPASYSGGPGDVCRFPQYLEVNCGIIH